jgi:hypothetical protein
MTEQDIDNIVNAHNQWKLRAGHVRLQSRYNPKLRAQAKRFLAWCEKNGLSEPKLFLDAHCEYHLKAHGRVQPMAFLPSKKALEQWERWAGGVALRQRSDQTLNATLENQGPAEKKIRPHQEKFKSHYVGREALCASYQEHTGGFNLQSRYCRACPAQSSCIASGRS